MSDPINPKHYKDVHGVKSIEFFKASATKEQWLGYLRLQAMKYLYRFNDKDTTKINAGKAKYFVDKLNEELEDEDNNKNTSV